jgi:uncharacterized membrane protein YozB (DUF420 family)
MSARVPTAAATPVALVVLSLVPLTAGALRLVEVAGGPAVLPPDARFTGFPVALVVHIVGSAVFALGGVLQLVPRVRRRHPAWHRRAGRVVAVAGLLVALSALWLTVGYEPRAGSGEVLRVFRLVFGSAMLVSLVLGFAAIRRRDVPAHRAWMIRAFTIGLAAGTQIFTPSLGAAVFGDGVLAADLAKGAGWVVNLAVAEWVVRRPSRGRARRRVVAVAAASSGARVAGGAR